MKISHAGVVALTSLSWWLGTPYSKWVVRSKKTEISGKLCLHGCAGGHLGCPIMSTLEVRNQAKQDAALTVLSAITLSYLSAFLHVCWEGSHWTEGVQQFMA